MKKFKSILCGALAFMAGSVALSACGVKTEPQTDPTEQTAVVGTKTTISLAEAKKIIVKALAINDNFQTQSLSTMALQTASANEGNRDIFQKLGRFNANDYEYEIDINTNEKLSESRGVIKAIYQNGFQTFLSDYDVLFKKYVVNGDCYTKSKSRGVEHKSNVDVKGELSGYQALFDDKAFDIIYGDTAIKEIKQNGYSITYKVMQKITCFIVLF